MKCQEARRWLHDWLDEQLSPSEREQLLDHLEHCPGCRAAQESLSRTVTLLQQISLEPAPAGFTARVMGSLPQERIRLGSRSFQRVLTAVVLFLALLASPYLYSTMNNPQLICQDHGAMILKQAGQFIIPAGQVISGDVTVYKADLLVLGKIEGSLRLVDGHLTLGDEASVSGEVAEEEASGLLRLKVALAELWEDIGGWLLRR
jgi:anti-sigma factor RsiW